MTDDAMSVRAAPIAEGATFQLLLAPGLPGRWDVIQKGVDKPLASFDTNHDAMAYACKLASLKKEATVRAFSRDLRRAVTVNTRGSRCGSQSIWRLSTPRQSLSSATPAASGSYL